MNRLLSALLIAGMFTIVFVSEASAITMMIGDMDGFGYGGAAGLFGADGNPADRNGNGILDAGDLLPDLNRDGILATGRGDDFDNRSHAEINGEADGSVWTDVSLSTSFDKRPGLTNDAYFNFQFDIPEEGDPGYGQMHELKIVYADFDVPEMYIEDRNGRRWDFNRFAPGNDGFIDELIIPVSWDDILNGNLFFDVVAPREPYIAFDYARLSAVSAPVPEPSTVFLMGSGLAGAFIRRRKRQA